MIARHAVARLPRAGATRPEDLDGEAHLVWDSGRVETSTIFEAGYAGTPLCSAMRYRWRVRTWGENGEDAGAATSWFEMGLLHDDDWAAGWVRRDPTRIDPRTPPERPFVSLRTRRLTPAPHLRLSYTADGTPALARVYCTARGVYQLRLNEARVGDSEAGTGVDGLPPPPLLPDL